MIPPTFSTALTSERGSGLLCSTGFGRPPCGASTIAIKISSGTPLYFISANTEGNVSKLQDEVLIFSIIRAVGRFARTIVIMSEFLSVVKLSWAEANEAPERKRVRTKRTDNRDLDMGILSRHNSDYSSARIVFEGLEVSSLLHRLPG